jgi:hypothetical protein
VGSIRSELKGDPRPLKKSRLSWLAGAGALVSIVALGAFFTAGGMTPPAATGTSAVITQPADTSTPTPTGTAAAPLLGPTGILQFRDGAAILEAVMTAPMRRDGWQYRSG